MVGIYTYNADGQCVRRKIDVETSQVYGFEGELLAEYAVSGAQDGDRKGTNWGNGGGWADSSSGSFPDWLQIDFNGSKTINEVDVFTVQDNYSSPSEPTETMTFSTYGLTGYDVQYWDGSGWVTISGASITGNNKVWRKLTFSPINTSKIRVLTNAAIDNGYSRIAEVEAWSPNSSTSSASINWLVTDQLGTPRMIFDKTGALANTKRHDYLPFGEELFAGAGGRTTTQGYTGDSVRQKFTQKERDNETGLDYFGARYYASTQGRFTSTDPMTGSGRTTMPQSWNRYSYVLNNPLRLIDPTGMIDEDSEEEGNIDQTPQQTASPVVSRVEKSNGNPIDEQTDRDLASLFTDTGIVRGASALAPTGDNHFRSADGNLHTIHVYGDESGNTSAGLYIPEGFTSVKYEGGQGIVAATNPQTGEVIGYAHVKGVKSQADLDRNLKSGKKNGAGSTFIGTIGGTGDGARGYVHGHIDIYKNAKARADIKQQKSRNGNLADATNTSGYSNFRKFISIFKRH